MLQLFRLMQVKRMRQVFNGHYVDVKELYVYTFNRIPNIQFIGALQVSAAFDFLYNEYKSEILHVYQHTYYHTADRKVYFNNTIFILSDQRMIELGDGYCCILFTTKNIVWSRIVTESLSQFLAVANTPAHTTVTGFARQEILN